MKAVFLFLVVSLVGCVGSPVYESENQVIPALSPDKARVVFFRYSAHGAVVGAELYQVIGKDKALKLIGGLTSASKMYIDLKPGNYTFMSNGSASLNFMNAEVIAGKTYYAVAAPYGWPGLAFSLNPVGKNSNPEFNLSDKKRDSILSRLVLVEPDLKDYEWGKKTLKRVQQRFDADWTVWESLSANDKAKFSIVPEYGK